MGGPPVERKRAPMPDSVGRYELLLPIASGGMATIYLARARGGGGFEREVAVKLTHAHLRDNAEFANDVLEEAKLAVRIRHPNVVSVLDAGDDPFGVYLVMDYIEGDTLGGLMRKPVTSSNVMPIGVGARVLLDALHGLHAAHDLAGEDGRSLGLVHRDFTPQNILVGLDGVARLADFGIARAESRLGHTRTGNIKGKFAFMSPEQARMAPLDRRCDVWAAGVIAWEMFTRQRLYPPGADELATLLKIATETPPRASSVRGDLHPAIDAAISHALSRDLEQRTPSAAAFAREIEAACGEAGVEIASREEVGALVRRVAGAKLTERRAQAKEVIALRARVGNLAESGGELTPSSIHAAAAYGRETLPDPSTMVDDEGSNAPATRSVHDDELSVSRDASATRARRRYGIAALGAVLAIGAGVIVYAFARDAAPPATAATTPPPRAEVTTSPVASAPSAPIEAIAASASAPAPASRSIKLAGNAAIASVRVGDRTIPIAPPATEVVIDLTPDEIARGARIDASAADGRRASVTLDAAATSASLRFPVGAGPAALPASPYGKHRP